MPKSSKIPKEYVKLWSKFADIFNEKIIEEFTGTRGPVNMANLDYAVWDAHKHALKEKDEDSFICEFVSRAIVNIIRFHPFVDGNKRTAYAFGRIVLLAYGKGFKKDYKESEKFLINIAKMKKHTSYADVRRWVEKNTYNLPISEKIELGLEMSIPLKYLKYIRRILRFREK